MSPETMIHQAAGDFRKENGSKLHRSDDIAPGRGKTTWLRRAVVLMIAYSLGWFLLEIR